MEGGCVMETIPLPDPRLEGKAVIEKIEPATLLKLEPPSPSVQRFMDAAFKPGDLDPLDGSQWVIPGIIYEGQTVVAPGQSGTAKTFVMNDWFARVALHLEFFGKPVLGGGAILV